MSKRVVEKEINSTKGKNPPIWAKLSSSIAYYLRTCDLDYSNEELLEDYLDFAYVESEIQGNILYLNKQTKEWVEIDKLLQDRIKTTFIERIEKMREKYNRPYEPKEKEHEEEEEKKVYTNNVIEFRKRN
ncbi:hypothetical protein [Clostridium perfringens]|uniref:Uncharacterized protein n=1 Tax=Clostridium perfringens E str. JGS1987 TaxID=451755 RepID=B1BY55_CLOPF|nr:hypothetical protein [Clostridium perfringens]EDT13364.1 conserved hypothetical protein [Clostridium perfringens E str. JGS1987]